MSHSSHVHCGQKSTLLQCKEISSASKYFFCCYAPMSQRCIMNLVSFFEKPIQIVVKYPSYPHQLRKTLIHTILLPQTSTLTTWRQNYITSDTIKANAVRPTAIAATFRFCLISLVLHSYSRSGHVSQKVSFWDLHSISITANTVIINSQASCGIISMTLNAVTIMNIITIADFCSAPSVITVPFQMYLGCILSAFQNQFDSVPVFCTTLARSASSLAGKAGKHYDNYYDIWYDYIYLTCAKKQTSNNSINKWKTTENSSLVSASNKHCLHWLALAKCK